MAIPSATGPGTEPSLAEAVRRSTRGKHLVVLLDFDGTLCEFEADPDAVRLPPRRREVLERLQKRATVGVISGRRLQDVRERCGIGDVVIAGLHGLEIEGLGERFVHPEMNTAAREIAAMARTLRVIAEGMSGVFVEDKGTSVALHYREASIEVQRRAIQAFTAAAMPYLDSGRLRLMPGACVVELLPNIDWNKGHAVRWITDRVRRRFESLFVVFIGDDVTDRDAFAAVDGQGLAIAASERVNASARLDGPAGVERFLSAL